MNYDPSLAAAILRRTPAVLVLRQAPATGAAPDR